MNNIGICEGCGKKKTLVAHGICGTCYSRSSSITKMVSGSKITIPVPFGHKKDANQFYKETKEAMLEDLLNNPGKWLDEVTGKRGKKKNGHANKSKV